MFLKPTKTKKKGENLENNPQTYFQERNETCLFEEKLEDIDVEQGRRENSQEMGGKT